MGARRGGRASRTWKLAPGAPGGIAQAFSAPLVGVLDDGVDGDAAAANRYDLVDLVGATRAAPFSIGAAEDTAACTP